MLLGIDVGGTHTDAVAVDLNRESGKRVVATAKVRTNHDDLLGSVVGALEEILKQVDPAEVRRLNLSTTLSTNAIVENRTEDVGVLVSSGPGIDPTNYMLCKQFHPLGGSIDHRGTEIRRVPPAEIDAALNACRADGIRVFAVVGKFSTRNPVHENTVHAAICRHDQPGPCSDADFVTLGHELGGRLNFPRRIATAYFNAAVWRLYNQFADAAQASLERLGLGHVRVHALKADGGTIPLSASRTRPVQSIFSGPAASVMGIIALSEIAHDSIILDIGGTTTDIAIFASGSPLLEPDGIDIGSHPTLVRALKVRSIGIGGDSAVHVLCDEVRVGPNRLGPCLAAGGCHPTLTDALNWTGLSAFGDVEQSRKGLASYAGEHTMPPDLLARRAVEYATQAIHDACRELVEDINSKPVYTIHELLEGVRIVPRKLYLMGGPAEALKTPLFERFRLATEVPANYAVANAVGAALTRVTTGIELFADTDKGVLFIPELGVRENIPARYSLEDAKRDAMNQLLGHLEGLDLARDGSRAEITHASSFNMVEGSRTVGRTIRVTCQLAPGVHRLSGD